MIDLAREPGPTYGQLRQWQALTDAERAERAAADPQRAAELDRADREFAAAARIALAPARRIVEQLHAFGRAAAAARPELERRARRDRLAGERARAARSRIARAVRAARARRRRAARRDPRRRPAARSDDPAADGGPVHRFVALIEAETRHRAEARARRRSAAYVELRERCLRIGGRAGVDQRVALDAVLAAAGVPQLVGCGDDELVRIVATARAWDADDTDTSDPAAEELLGWATQGAV